MICILLNNKFDCFDLSHGLVYIHYLGGMWLNGVGQNKETDEEHD